MLKKGINYLFSAIFIIFAFCLFMNSSTYYQVAHFSMEKVLLFAVCIVAILFFFYRIAVKSGPVQHFLKYHRFSVLAIVMTVLLTIQIFFICTVYTPIGWDCSAVIMQAAKGNGFDSYFLRYPNNIFLCVIYRILFFLVSALHFPANYWLWADVLNVFFIDAAIVLGVLVCDKIFSIKTYYFFLIISILVIGLSPYLTVAYSDTAAMPFPIAVIYCWLLCREADRRWKKILLSFLIGFFSLTGFFIKPTALIALIALAIFLLIDFFSKKKPKQKSQTLKALPVTLCAIMLLFGAGTVYLANQKAESVIYKEIYSRKVYGPQDQYLRQVPLTHHLMIGLKETKSEKGIQYGGFNMEDNVQTIKVLGKNEKIVYHSSVIKQRLYDFGVKGLLAHLYHKAVWVSTDGTFYYGGEGENDFMFHYKVNKSDSDLRGFLQNITYAQTPFYQQYYANYQQALWAIILLLLAVSFFVRANEKRGNVRFVLQLSIIGLLIFLMIFEARSRYLILFLPFYLLLASDNLAEMTGIRRKNKSRHALIDILLFEK